MSKLIKVKRSDPVNLDSYVNKDTGEMMSSELNGLNMKSTFDTGTSVVSYDDYAVISSDAVLALQSVLNDSDLAKVMKMSVTVKTGLNILFNNSVPHTNKTLQRYLMINSEAMFIALVKRLMKVGVLYQMKGLIYGDVRLIYLMNPYVCRKRKVFENKVLEVFKDFEYK